MLKALADLSSHGLTIEAIPDVPDDVQDPPREQLRTIHLVATDRVGILSEVSEALRDAKANVLELETSRDIGPHSGEMMFHLDAVIAVPAPEGDEPVRQALKFHFVEEVEEVLDLAFGEALRNRPKITTSTAGGDQDDEPIKQISVTVGEGADSEVDPTTPMA